MDWLGQNWVWVLAGIAFLVLMSRGGLGHHGHGGGFGGGHGGHGGGLPGGGHGDHGDSEGGDSRGPDVGGGGGVPGAAIDPVSGNAVRQDRALTSVHRGRVFYFESAETRQRFEAEPDRYAGNVAAAEPSAPPQQRRRHHGC